MNFLIFVFIFHAYDSTIYIMYSIGSRGGHMSILVAQWSALCLQPRLPSIENGLNYEKVTGS